MSSQHSEYSGPPLDVETWIERGTPGHWLTGKGGKGDVAHFEFNHDFHAEEQWVREYAVGRKEFRDPHIAQAREFADSGKYAEAVIASRMALEIPWQGGSFTFNQGVVLRAMGYEDTFWAADKTMDDIRDEIKQSVTAMQEAFDTPYEIKMELEGIVRQGRSAISGRGVSAWTDAVNYFGERGELHAAGVSAIELGAAYKNAGQTTEAISAFRAAGELLRRRLGIVMAQGNSTRHTAEVNELSCHLAEALVPMVELYSATGSMKNQDKELFKAAVYELDDLGGFDEIVQHGYELLAKASRFREKRFYKREATGIAGELAVAKFFEENPDVGGLWDGPGPRKNRRHLRPPVADK